MALPAPPVRGYSFTSFSTNNPSTPQPGVNLDAEIDRSNTAITQLLQTVAVSVNADGSLSSAAVQAAYAAGSGGSGGGTNIADAPSQKYAELAQAWAEYIAGPIPADKLAADAITGTHYSASWWAQQAAGQVQVQQNQLYAALAAGQLNYNNGAPGGPILAYAGMALSGGTLQAQWRAGDVTAVGANLTLAGTILAAPNVVAKSGDTMTGALVLSGAPTLSLHAATKTYVDTFGTPADQLAGFRNWIINGAMEVWQRGTTFNAVATGAFLADHWFDYHDGAGSVANVSVLAYTSLPQALLDAGFIYALTYQVTTAGSGTTARQLNQRIPNVKSLSGRTVTLSFWAVADAARTLGASITQVFGTGGSPSGNVATATQNVGLTTTWTKFTLTFALPTISGKTVGSNNDSHLQLSLVLPVNTLLQISITGVQIEVGTVATPFEWRPFGVETALCQRYFQTYSGIVFGGYNVNGGQAWTPLVLPVAMRAAPTVAFVGTTYANMNTVSANTVSTSVVSLQALATATGLCWTNTGLTLTAEL